MTQFIIFVCVFLAFLGAFLLLTKAYRWKPKVVLRVDHRSRLIALAERSLASLDVPVGALLLYRGEIIGEGYNTVLSNKKAGEHAEVNAISDAITKLGPETFSQLDRDSLLLVSTFEPCCMCVGAFIEYNIRNVYFVEEKDFKYLGREISKLAQYFFHRKQVQNNGEQRRLFERHPQYPERLS